MSQPRGPDPDQHGPVPADGARGEQHPDEALAAYVDGSASASEVALVRSHLSTCARCREEVEIARRAVRALKDLPELDPPWVDAGRAVESVGSRDAGSARSVRSLDERRSRTRTAVRAAVGLAAAASIAAVLLLVDLGGSGSDSATSPTLAAQAGAPNVTGDDLTSLTGRLAGSVAPSAKASASGELAAAGGASRSEPRLPAKPTIAPDAVAGVPCARRASGQTDSAVVVYAQIATFQGKRVWVVGFVATPTSGGTPRVEVVAATTNGCTVVYVGRQPLLPTP